MSAFLGMVLFAFGYFYMKMKYRKERSRVFKMSQSFHKMADFMFNEAIFLDSRGKWHGDVHGDVHDSLDKKYDSSEVANKWKKFHELQAEFNKIRGEDQ